MTHENASLDVHIQRLEDQRYHAVLTGDLETFEGLCHPRLVYTHTRGDRDSLVRTLASSVPGPFNTSE